MSLILDALRKIELERKAKRHSPQELRRDVLNYRGTAPAEEKSRVIPIAAALLLFFATVAVFFYFKKAEPVKIVTAPPEVTVMPEAAPPPPAQTLQVLPRSPVVPTVRKNLQTESKIPSPPVTQAAEAVVTKLKSGDEGINVSGIAWQEQRSLRRAVINGYLVGEGAEIQGAKIVEIKEGSIRFRRGTDLFEVVHSSGAGQ